jgi:hypothetical protein
MSNVILNEHELDSYVGEAKYYLSFRDKKFSNRKEMRIH